MRKLTGQFQPCVHCLKSTYFSAWRLTRGSKFCSIRCAQLHLWRDTSHHNKLSEAHKGKTHTVNTKKKMSLARKGKSKGFQDYKQEKHWNWQGGITPINEKIRRSTPYKQWRWHVFQRDDYTCQACGIRGVKLHADHELPFAIFADLRFEILNGRTLCVSCHRATPTFGANTRMYV